MHEINVLTVIASESYEQFAKQLQHEIAAALSDRPRKADMGFFMDKVLTNARGEPLKIGEKLAAKLQYTFIKNGYVDDQFRLTDDYYAAVERQDVKLPNELLPYKEPLIEMIKTIYAAGKEEMTENDRDRNIPSVTVNGNFYKKKSLRSCGIGSTANRSIPSGSIPASWFEIVSRHWMRLAGSLRTLCRPAWSNEPDRVKGAVEAG